MGKNLRLICMAFVATLAVALCACGGPDPASGITFRNATDDIDVVVFYISSTTSDNWDGTATARPSRPAPRPSSMMTSSSTAPE